MIFDITKSIFDNTKSIFSISQIRFCDIKKSQWFCDIKKKSIVWYHKIEYVMSQIQFFDTTKSIFDIKTLILWYHKLFVDISK